MYFVFVLILISSVSNVFSDINNVIVLSFDGIHPSYITNDFTPNLIKLIKDNNGIGPFDMHSVFPTKTNVTHFSVSTGLYPCNHGVYNNEMFGPDDVIWSHQKEQFQTKTDVVPIWIENQSKGGERNSGVMMWPGADFDYNGTKAQYIEPYNASMDWNQRVEKIVSWMTNASKKANLVMAYFEDTPCNDKRKIDTHIREHMQKIDNTIQKLYNDLQNKLKSNVDIIIMSDHGTQMVPYKNVLLPSTYLKNVPTSDYTIIISGPIVFIKPKPEKFSAVMTAFDANIDSAKKFLAVNVNDLRARFNLGLNSLTKIIVVMAVSGYTFFEESKLQSIIAEVEGEDNFVTYENGYDNWNLDMNGFFVGIGKHFNHIDFTTVHLEILDIYPMLKVLLDLKTDVNTVQAISEYPETVREILIEEIVPPRKEDTSNDESGDSVTVTKDDETRTQDEF